MGSYCFPEFQILEKRQLIIYLHYCLIISIFLDCRDQKGHLIQNYFTMYPHMIISPESLTIFHYKYFLRVLSWKFSFALKPKPSFVFITYTEQNNGRISYFKRISSQFYNNFDIVLMAKSHLQSQFIFQKIMFLGNLTIFFQKWFQIY